ncbi:spermine oxidase-like [Malaya genurostris]|uniref:spermine oxidase-like n=1 Tax=Malaya genurostris TaxID=325434 RepID=UPI0026F3F939|nr:spermine oxidase-like [Malaya genurostris]
MSARVVIIGAGSAGIAAATRLYEHGFRNVTILEATGRIGGRVHTVPFGENVIDCGAQWCHGEKNNVVYEMAGPLALLESSVVAEKNVLLKSDGEVVQQEQTDRLMILAERIVESEDLYNSGGTLGDFFVERFTKEVNEEKMKDIDRKLVRQFLEFYHGYQKGYIAIDSWYDYPADDDSEDCEGDDSLSWMGKGYKSILDLLMKRHPSQNNAEPIPIEKNIEFNKFVENIHWNKGPDQPITIRCADGSRYEASHVIITVSLGVLKENINTLFTPQLPSVKQNAIKGIHFGTVNKAIFEFETPFWTEMGNTFGLLWNSEELEKIRTSKYAWTEGVSAFFKIDRQPKLLGAWMMGKECRQAELIPDSEITEGILFLLGMFFKNKQIDQPLRMKTTQWFSDPYFRGSYSSPSLATRLLKTDYKDMAIPLTDSLGTPALLFAGEATNGLHYGTVHGAIKSGWREADRIINFYKK